MLIRVCEDVKEVGRGGKDVCEYPEVLLNVTKYGQSEVNLAYQLMSTTKLNSIIKKSTNLTYGLPTIESNHCPEPWFV